MKKYTSTRIKHRKKQITRETVLQNYGGFLFYCTVMKIGYLQKNPQTQVRASEMKFVQRVTLVDQARYEIIREELQIFHINNKINGYRRCWKEHVEKKEEMRCLKQALQYKLTGRRLGKIG